MPMSKEHKDALARGRRESRAIKAYLHSIDRRKPGRPLKTANVQSRLDSVNARFSVTDDPLQRLDLLQSRIDLKQAIAAAKNQDDPEKLEADFVATARPYSERKGITYSAWRDYGVPAAVLKKAGIPETRHR